MKILEEYEIFLESLRRKLDICEFLGEIFRESLRRKLDFLGEIFRESLRRTLDVR